MRDVLATRLIPPRLPDRCLPREDLVSSLLRGSRGRLVAVVAGAGYGKSTLLAQALVADDRPWIWISCDERLGDDRAFLAHVAAGVGRCFPGVASALPATSTGAAVTALCNELAVTVLDDLVIAIDDAHSLVGTAAAATLGQLVADLPPNVHLVVAGRRELPFASRRARARGFVELGERQLALTSDEASEYVRYANPALGPAAVAELCRQSEGWLVGLRLGASSGGTAALHPGAAFGGDVDALVDEVLEHEDPAVRSFLFDLSVLERFTSSLAEAVTGRPDADAVISELLVRHLFVIPLGEDGWYRFHHLFRAALTRLRHGRAEADAEVTLHRCAATAWVQAGDRVEAARHLLVAGDLQAVADALDPVAEEMAAGSGAAALAELIDALPVALRTTRPGLVLAHATLLFSRSRHEAGFAEIEQAIETLLDANEHERAAAALFRLFQAMFAAGTRGDRRVAAGTRYLDRIDPAAPTLPFARMFQAAGYGYVSRFADARAEIDAALSLPSARDSVILPAYAGIISAFYIASQTEPMHLALRALDEALDDLVRLEEYDVLSFLPVARGLRCYILNDLGRYEECLDEVGRMLEGAERRGVEQAVRRVVGWLRGVAFAGLQRWEDAAEAVDVPSRSPQLDEPSSYVYRLRGVAARVAAHRGDAVEARAHIEAARTEIAAFGYVSDLPYHLGDLAIAADAAGLSEIACDICTDLLVAAHRTGSPSFVARACMLAVAIDPDDPRSDEHLGEALALTSSRGLEDLWVRREHRYAGPLLARALERGLGPPGSAARLAALCGPEVMAQVVRALPEVPTRGRLELAQALTVAPVPDVSLLRTLRSDAVMAVRDAASISADAIDGRPRPPLRLITLGGFTILRAGMPVPDLAFGRQRGRALLAVLVARGEPVHRDQLIEWLWPHLTPEKGRQSLHSTLYTLRRTIDPSLGQGSGTLIQTDGDAYVLELGPRDEWDAQRFLSLVERASSGVDQEQEIARLLAAERAYGGTFLPEWPYEDWASEPRAEIERTYEGLVERLAERLLEAGRPGSAIERASRLVVRDPEWEAWHRLLMRAYAAAGERPRALRQFHACRTILREQLGVEPGDETQELYRALL